MPLPNTSFPVTCNRVLCRSIETGYICRLGRANGESKDNFALQPRGVHGLGACHIGALATQMLSLALDSCYFPQLSHFTSISTFFLNKFYSFPMSSNSSGSHPGRGGEGGPQGRGNRGGRGGRGGANGRGRGGTLPVDRTGVPRGICAYYWSTGFCDWSFDCTFKHEVKSSVLGTSVISATETDDQSPDFFSRDGLAMNNGSVVDSRHTLRPNEAHNHLKLYLADDFVFRDANNVEGFSRIFASVNSRNKAWVRVTLIRIRDFSMAHTS
jgi:hypothetical protein